MFIKVVYPDAEVMKLKGILFFNLDQPIDLKLLQQKAELSDEDLANYDLFIEPYSNQ